MTRETALAVWDRLIAMGYRAEVGGYDVGRHGRVMADGQPIGYDVGVAELSLDSVDLRALVALADEMGLDAKLSAMSRTGALLHFVDAPSEAEVRKRAVIDGPRKHPRSMS